MAEFWTGIPEGAVPLVVGAIGFFGAVAGSMLGFFATHLSTSRQITRSQRETRLDVYSDFLSKANAFSATISDLEQVDGVFQGIRPATSADTADIGALIASVRREVHAGAAKSEAILERVASDYDALAAEHMRVALVAPPDVEEAAHDVLAVGHELTAARGSPAVGKTYWRVLGDFTRQARADIRSPGAVKSHRVILRRTRKVDAIGRRRSRRPLT
jgi:hypothetical protein